MSVITKKTTYVDAAIARTTAELKNHQVTSKEYALVLERLSKLHTMRQEEKPKGVSPDNALMAAANLVGVFLILHHEHLHPITTKAMSFIKFR